MQSLASVEISLVLLTTCTSPSESRSIVETLKLMSEDSCGLDEDK